jgi:hypothetical protein
MELITPIFTGAAKESEGTARKRDTNNNALFILITVISFDYGMVIVSGPLSVIVIKTWANDCAFFGVPGSYWSLLPDFVLTWRKG